MKITAERWMKIGAVLLACLWLGLVAASWADAQETATGTTPSSASEASRSPASVTPSSSDDEYNFNWLDPEKKIYVLQNRRYLKANRLMLSALAGVGFSNPYRSAYNFDPRITYYFSESWGIELFYTLTANVVNSTFNALAGTHSNILPVIREVRSQWGGTAQWVPWYAKINVFNKILYFDWYFNAGAGDMRAAVYNSSADGITTNPNEVDQDYFAFYLGTGHIYHITDSLLVRLDFNAAIYTTQIYGTGGGATWYSNLNFGAGVGWRL
jgi:outer membrane beta-barrel protein